MSRIPSDAINEIKCTLCGNYLSYFPILSTDEEDVCGRCSIPEGKVVFHNRAFEKVAQHIKFPCRFKEQGCVKELLPEDVPYHERNCHFKIVKCPGKEFTGCSWQGACNNMLSHCRDTHKDLFLEDKSFVLNLEVSSSNFYLQKFLKYDGALFIVAIIQDLVSLHPKTVSFMIYHVEDEIIDLENYSYQVVLSRDGTDVMVKSSTTTFSERIWRKIGLDCLMMNDETSIIGNIVFEKSIDDITLNGFNEKLLTVLSCARCKNYTLPPIQCLCNYLKCRNCVPVITKCECHCSPLNEIAKMLDYPCRYKKNGCHVVLKSEKMEKHLSICQFKSIVCWVCCISTNEKLRFKQHLKKDLKNHIFQTHCDLIIVNGKSISVENNDTDLKHLIHWDNKLFLLRFSRTTTDSNAKKKVYYQWGVYILDNVDEKYQYEIEVMNPKSSNVRILIQQECLPMKILRNEECKLKNLSEILRLEESIVFKVNIFKN